MLTQETKRHAVVDLGSNSFHLIIAECQGSSLRYIDHWKEPVRIADGILPDGTLSEEKQHQALEVLRSYRKHLDTYPIVSSRVIATSAFRKARNSGEFVQIAEVELGLPIEVISGREEARLIYRGVSTVAKGDPDCQHLVMDIGGGSTEIIIGSSDVPTKLVSIEFGNISLHRKLFRDKTLSRKLFKTAKAEIVQQIENEFDLATALNWNMSIGASGTFRLIEHILSSLGLAENGITRHGIDSLVEYLLDGSSKKRKVLLKTVPEERRESFPAALAIVQALFDFFSISYMHISELGIRDGILSELADLPHTRSRSDQTLHEMMEFYSVNKFKAQQVKNFVRSLLPQINEYLTFDQESSTRLLKSAAHIFEIGKALHFRGYHKHGAYIVMKSSMPGFSKLEQGQIAFLVLNQRKRLKTTHSFAKYPVDWGMVALFRLGCLFINQSVPEPVKQIEKMSWENNCFTLTTAKNFMESHPILRTTLEREQDYWAEMGIKYIIT